MKVNDVELVISAVREDQYPNDPLPEIALAGRSNVGKSSFINRMIQRKGMARISARPGKTQTLNFYLINQQLYFVDVPGYGYAKVSKKERQAWGKMMENYFSKRKELKLAVLIVDLRHNPTEDDLLMYDFLKHYEIPVLVIATKMDKVAKTKRPSHLKKIKEALDIEPEDQIIPFSSETGEGKDEAWGAIRSFVGK
ncbi:ribosome biogenesis GTP-binding protein YihA/YsxC [Salinibacillus xinjiangensis]|uniref:Probable GTP-binding protein EngB n=1 Tax=Salinibacillus xinjiangensis TaxID=1229268 RepID=A0A6G1XBV5_9BACI|nr:ribosome biogenesis GTP-binding protein YihA/YsxC [Salinibacillus xinjiangensis]MRG88360.1 YihA family ribosome biogenesis GTP-binding protein [Salinibacillus xinjiangensis]